MGKYAFKLIYLIISLLIMLPFLGIFLEGSNIEHWKWIIESPKTYEAAENTIIVALIALGLNILLGTPVAEIMAKYDFPGKKLVELLILLPIIIPGFVTTMGIQFMFIKIGLTETLLGVGIVHSLTTFPYYIRSLQAGYSTISRDYEKMGKIYGASPLKIFFKINFPMLIPAFVAGSSLVIIVSFAQYLITLIIGGGEIITLPILMFPFISGGDVKVGAVYSIVYIFTNLILVLLLEKWVLKIYFNRGQGEKIGRN